MVLEAYGGLLVGAVLTLVVSIATMLLTHHFSESQWRKQKKSEDRRIAIEQVYSPLYFFLDDLLYPLGMLGSYMFIVAEGGQREGFINDLGALMQKERGKIDSKILQSLMWNKLGFIAPSEFRDDLLRFLWLLQDFEEEFSITQQYLNEWENTALTKKRLNNYHKVTHSFRLAIAHFIEFLNEKVLGKETDLSEIEYKPFLNAERLKTIRSFMSNELSNPYFDEKFDSFYREVEKDLKIKQRKYT
jgi:hypothetical protein